jgi:hypothetical protein
MILAIATTVGGGFGGDSSETPTQLSAGSSPSPADPRATPMRVEPNVRNTFGPGRSIPSGTTLYLEIMKTADTSGFRLHLCGTPCNTATTVKIWEPGSFRSGDVLTHQVTQAGEYYLWHQETRSGNPSPATADERRQNAQRITFKSGAVVHVWYITP